MHKLALFSHQLTLRLLSKFLENNIGDVFENNVDVMLSCSEHRTQYNVKP